MVVAWGVLIPFGIVMAKNKVGTKTDKGALLHTRARIQRCATERGPCSCSSCSSPSPSSFSFSSSSSSFSSCSSCSCYVWRCAVGGKEVFPRLHPTKGGLTRLYLRREVLTIIHDRDAIPPPSRFPLAGFWFKVHRFGNALGCILTFAGFAAIALAYKHAKDPNFVIIHAKIGQVIVGY